jgi:hypothetical protein
MARGKAINVKIATAKVIKALETKLAELNKDKAEQANNEAKYDKAYKSWQKEVGKLCVAQMSKAEDISANTRYNGEVSVSFSIPKGLVDLPEAPQKDFNTYHDWQFKEMIGEIENAIRILKMTDEEVVSTSTYNTIAQYL